MIKKILFINNLASISHILGEEFKKRKIDYDIIDLYKKEVFWSESKKDLNKNIKEIELKEYDVVYYNIPYSFASVFLNFKCKLNKVNFVVHFHGYDARARDPKLIFYRTLSCLGVKLAFYSTPDLRNRLWWFLGKKVFLPSPISIKIKNKKNKVYSKRILVFQRIEKEKGLVEILKIVKQLPQFQFDFIKLGKEKDIALFNKLKGKNCNLINPIKHENVGNLLSKYKVILGQYSPYGVIGVSEFEAMSLEKPTLFYFDKKYDAFYKEPVPRIDYNAKNILDLMNNNKKRKELGKKQKEWVLKYLNPKNIVDTMLTNLKLLNPN
ncbi:MAG: hypothetical protein ACP5OZ_01740 [Candidatus Woesearchaeota archaeon]